MDGAKRTQVVCPACGKQWGVPEESLDKGCECPVCGERLPPRLRDRTGGLRLRAERGNLRFVSRPKREAPQQVTTGRMPSGESPGTEIDLRGMRAEEVIPVVSSYIDSAYLAGLPYVHLIHGKGTGVLKQVVRQMLKGHKLVDSFRPGDLREGGEGITVAKLHSLGG